MPVRLYDTFVKYVRRQIKQSATVILSDYLVARRATTGERRVNSYRAINPSA